MIASLNIYFFILETRIFLINHLVIIKFPHNILFTYHMSLKQPAGLIQPSTANREELLTSERASEQEVKEHNFQYYEQYRRLFNTAFLLSEQLRQLSKNKEDMWGKIAKLEKKTEEFKDDIRGEAPERKKRFRRAAQQIERPFECQVQRCRKCYGSEGSLQQHLKLKHPDLYSQKSQQKKSNIESQGNRNNSYQFD